MVPDGPPSLADYRVLYRGLAKRFGRAGLPSEGAPAETLPTTAGTTGSSKPFAKGAGKIDTFRVPCVAVRRLGVTCVNPVM
jgi:hypothetical protein